MPYEQARAICAPKARLAADQARSQARAQKQTEPYQSGYTITAAGDAAAKQAGDSTFSGCLAENGWRLER